MSVTVANTNLSISKKFSFSAAHKLDGCSEACSRLHGHNYKVTVFISGVMNELGVIFDLKEFSHIFKEKVIERLDHTLLNEVLKDINPTIENLAYWIWRESIVAIEEMEAVDILLEKIFVEETDTCSALIERKS